MLCSLAYLMEQKASPIFHSCYMLCTAKGEGRSTGARLDINYLDSFINVQFCTLAGQFSKVLRWLATVFTVEVGMLLICLNILWNLPSWKNFLMSKSIAHLAVPQQPLHGAAQRDSCTPRNRAASRCAQQGRAVPLCCSNTAWGGCERSWGGRSPGT